MLLSDFIRIKETYIISLMIGKVVQIVSGTGAFADADGKDVVIEDVFPSKVGWRARVRVLDSGSRLCWFIVPAECLIVQSGE